MSQPAKDVKSNAKGSGSAKKTKMVQPRLAFKALDPKSVTQPPVVSSNNNSKKRKLSSDGNPPGGKLAKTPKSDDKSPKCGSKSIRTPKSEESPKPQSECINEVSSSSETTAESSKAKTPASERKAKARTLLERFVRTEKVQTEEVSTTKNDEYIDLTDSNGDAIAKCKDADKENVIENSEASNSSEMKSENPSSKSQSEESDCKPSEAEVKSDKVEKNSNETSAAEVISEDSNSKSSDKADASMNLSCLSEGKDVSMMSVTEDDSLADASESENEDKSEASPVANGDKNSESAGKSETKVSSSEKTDSKPKPAGASRARNSAEKEKRKLERERINQAKKEKREQEKLQKQKEKEAKEAEKKAERQKREAERQELRNKKEKERLEKLEEKEREKEEKQKQKDEEMKKKQEQLDAKNEEKKKKDEEKRKAEEEENAKKNKVKQNFAKFFMKKETKATEETKVVETTKGPFQQFQLKDNMELAPSHRVDVAGLGRRKAAFDELFNKDLDSLYVDELRGRTFNLGHCKRKSRQSSEDDVVIVSSAGEKEKAPGSVMRAKYLHFHENYRPPYYGTWRKKSNKLSPRNPLKKDADLFDYEVHSDDEWEEEEPGESLSNSEGEGEDAGDGEEDEEEADGFFVPHGYLSDDEGAVEGEDEEEENAEGGSDKDKKKVLEWAGKHFEDELNKKVKELKAFSTGCQWWQPELSGDPMYTMLKDYQAVSLISVPFPIPLDELTPADVDSTIKDSEKEKEKKKKPQSVPEEDLPDLIRLTHGNIWSLPKIVKEFRVFISRKNAPEEPLVSSSPTVDAMDVDSNSKPDEGEAGGLSPKPDPAADAPKPDPAADAPKPDPAHDAKYCLISAQVLKKCIKSMAKYEKRDGLKRGCWYVNQEVLEKHALTELPVPTAWRWITRSNDPPAKKATPAETEQDPAAAGRQTPTPSTPVLPSIKQFTVPQSQLPSPVLHRPTPTKPTPSQPSSPAGITKFTVPQSQLPSPLLNRPTPTKPAPSNSQPSSPAGITNLFSPKIATPDSASTPKHGAKSNTPGSTPKASQAGRNKNSTPISLFCKKITKPAENHNDSKSTENNVNTLSSLSVKKLGVTKSSSAISVKKVAHSAVSSTSEATGEPLPKMAKLMQAPKISAPIVIDDDDDCMIVDSTLPEKPPKGQPSMFSMLKKAMDK